MQVSFIFFTGVKKESVVPWIRPHKSTGIKIKKAFIPMKA